MTLSWFGTALLGAAALFWILLAIEMGRGVPALASLADAGALPDRDCPSVSILFAARQEADKLPGALATILALDYPRYEVVAADDRSEDNTGQILRDAAQNNPRLKFVRIDSLPNGWLGKPHAMQQAYEQSSGEWLVFTDADVHFAPDVLRRAISLAFQEKWDHLTLLGRTEMFSFGEKLAMTFFTMAFLVGARPWRVSNSHSQVYAGVGSFQLLRRSAYEASGTHRRLAMEVIDDMKLGKLVKEAGFRSGVARAGAAVRVHWQAGVKNIIRGTTKNFFAAAEFRLGRVLLTVFGLLLLCVLPWAALPFVHGWARVFDAIAVVVPVLAQAGAALELEVSPLYALTCPVGALIFAWTLVRSTIVTLWRGGITWRGTFYPLEELKRGVV